MRTAARHVFVFVSCLLALALASANAPVALFIRDDAASIQFGSNLDVNLYRKDSDTLRTDDSVEIGGGTVSIAVN